LKHAGSLPLPLPLPGPANINEPSNSTSCGNTPRAPGPVFRFLIILHSVVLGGPSLQLTRSDPSTRLGWAVTIPFVGRRYQANVLASLAITTERSRYAPSSPFRQVSRTATAGWHSLLRNHARLTVSASPNLRSWQTHGIAIPCTGYRSAARILDGVGAARWIDWFKILGVGADNLSSNSSIFIGMYTQTEHPGE
jgi:hypothetical protein